jgi:hypothetical protein
MMLTATAAADEPSLHVHAEVDPLPFVQKGYGAQIGWRDDSVIRGLRFAVASFSLDVPDFAAELGGNDDFHIRVRPSGAAYVLYYLQHSRNSVLVGGSIRVLRLSYTHDDVANTHDDVSEISPEAIVGYMWHPTKYGFYLQPWFGLSATVWRSHDPRVGDRMYEPPALNAFFTVNLGFELVR